MSYVWGFLVAVPEENKAAYIESAEKSWPLFRDYGATAHWECWEEDVPEGEVTSFPMAVKREPGEKVVFSWVVFPDKAAATRCHESFGSDPRWEEMTMPFDAKRMVYGYFDTVFAETA